MKYYKAAALARALGMREDEIKSLTRSGVIKNGVTDGGLYDIETAAREIITALKNTEESERDADYQSEKAQLMRIKRRNAEYDLELKKKTLHKTEDLELAISTILVNFKSRIRSIPSRVAPRVAGMSDREEIFDLMKQITDEALLELSNLTTILSGQEENQNDG